MEFKSFKTLMELSDNFTNEDVCRKYLEHILWDGKPVCPHCGALKPYAFKGGKLYKCSSNQCYKKFTVKVGTFLESSKLPLCKWFHAIYVFTSHKKGISSLQLAKDIGITPKSAWFVLSKIREILREKNPFILEGVTEIDETYSGGKVENMHASKRKYAEDGSYISNKKPVIGILNRSGKAALVPVKSATLKEVMPLISKHVKRGSTIVTDSSSLYKSLFKKYYHESVNHSVGEYKRDSWIHSNGVESLFSHLKRGIYGIYHQVSPKHLHRYCNEFAFRYNTRKMGETERFNLALKQVAGRLKYRELISKNW